jgi:hypothetical protein
MAIQMHTENVIVALAGQGLRAMELKGPGLAERAHGDVGLRWSGDIDILVHRDDLPASVDLLRTMGYEAPRDPVDRQGLPMLHFSLEHATRLTVEVHWRVHWYEDAFSADLLRRATPSGTGSLVAEPKDEAAAILLFMARDGFFGLRILSDLTGWWERNSDPARRGLLDDHVDEYPELRRAWQAAAIVAEQAGGLPAGGLVSEVKPDRRMTRAVRLSAWSHRDDRDQLAANVALIDGLLAPPSTLGGFVRRLLQPEHPLAHVVKVSLRWVYAVWRIRRYAWEHDLLDGVRHRRLLEM